MFRDTVGIRLQHPGVAGVLRGRHAQAGAAHAARTGFDRSGAFSNVSGCANHQRSDQQRHQTQYRRQDPFWDGLIVETALAERADLLVTEDLQDGWQIGSMRVWNPSTLMPRNRGSNISKNQVPCSCSMRTVLTSKRLFRERDPMLLSHSSNDSQGCCYPHEQKNLSERDICTKFITPSLPAGFVDELPDVLVPDQVWREVQWHRPGVLGNFAHAVGLLSSIAAFRGHPNWKSRIPCQELHPS